MSGRRGMRDTLGRLAESLEARLAPIEEGYGLIVHRPRTMRLGDGGEDRAAAPRRFLSLHYVAWFAFVFFWVVFARGVIPYYMTSTVFSSTKGIALRGMPRLTAEEADALLDGEPVRDGRGFVAIDPGAWDVREVRVEAGGGPASDRVCGPDGRRVLALVRPDAAARYDEVVAALDRLLTTARDAGCTVRPQLVGGVGP